MNRLFRNRMAIAALAVLALLVCAGRVQATDISGNISTTLTIVEDSRLIDDVTCTVPLTAAGANPCIIFGADDIKLRLNGHTITGPVADPPTGCSVPGDSKFGVGIEANGNTDVKIVACTGHATASAAKRLRSNGLLGDRSWLVA